MEKGIYISEEFLQTLREAVVNLSEKYSIHFQIVKIFGKRYSFIAGDTREDSFLPVSHIALYKNFAVVSNEWDKLSLDQREKFLNSLRKVFYSYDKK